MIDFFNNTTEGEAVDFPSSRGVSNALPLSMAAGFATEALSGQAEADTTTAVNDIKAAAMAPMHTATGIGGAAVMGTAPLVNAAESFYGIVTDAGAAPKHDAADKVFKFYEDYIQPAGKYWTPDPESISYAGRLLGGLTGLLPYMALGPAAIPAMAGSATVETGVDLTDKGVDANTAGALSALSGTAATAMASIPFVGKGLAQKIAFGAASFPAVSAAHEEAAKLALKAAGYDKEAETFNPFDVSNRSIDLLMGAMFGGFAHYSEVRKVMPIQAEDSIDTAAIAQNAAKSSPFEVKDVETHTEALGKAIDDLNAGRPVDVVGIVKDTSLKTESAPVEPEAVKVQDAAITETTAAQQEAANTIDKATGAEVPALKGDFGPVYEQFKGNAQGAVKHLMEAKTGEAVAALHHKDIGDIDLVWGKEGTPGKDYSDGYGLAKIAQKHPEVLDRLQEVIDEMDVKSKSGNRVILESHDHKAAVRLDWDGEAKHWLISAYKKSDTSSTGGSTYVPSSIGGEPTPSPQDVSSLNIPLSPGEVKGQANSKEVIANGQEKGREEVLNAAQDGTVTPPAGKEAALSPESSVTPSEAARQAEMSLKQKVSVNASVEGKTGALAHDAALAERTLAENPDMQIYSGADAAGNPEVRSAREYIDDGKTALHKSMSTEELFNMAADCLIRG